MAVTFFGIKNAGNMGSGCCDDGLNNKYHFNYFIFFFKNFYSHSRFVEIVIELVAINF